MKYLKAESKRAYIEFIIGACNRRMLDAKNLSTFFGNNGYNIVSNPRKADVILLISCGVSKKREDNSIKRINKLKRFKGELVICGCLPKINNERLSLIHNGLIIPTYEHINMDKFFPYMIYKYSKLDDSNRYFSLYNGLFSYRFILSIMYKLEIIRALSIKYIIRKGIPGLVKKMIKRNDFEKSPFSIRISWGCNRKCSYCGIRYAVGKFQSKPLETCLYEFKKGLDLGYKEFEIIADDVGAYGIDIGETFADLLKSFFSIQRDYSVLIWNLAPIWLIKYQDDFIPILQQNKISRIHYPIQSGSSKILLAMKRYSNTEKIKESIIFLKAHSNNLVLTTDIIVGYPGETEDDINKTIDLLCSVKIDGVGIFRYNDVSNTVASESSDKIELYIIQKRAFKVQRTLKRNGIECGII